MLDRTVLATLVIVFRETLKASLVVGIILTVLARLGAWRYASHVWTSTTLAAGASGLAAWALQFATAAAQAGE